MQFLMTAAAAMMGMTVSLGTALFVEELIFGKVLRVAFRQSHSQEPADAQQQK